MSLISSILSFLGSISSIFSFFLEKEKHKEVTLRYIKSDLIEIKDNKEYNETVLDGLQIYHNPFAEKALPKEAFDKYEITHIYYDLISKKVDNQQKSYTIISRNR
jgi:hypothetical protein